MNLKKNIQIAFAAIFACVMITSIAFSNSLPTISVAPGAAKNTTIVTADTGFQTGDVVRVFIETKKGTAEWQMHWAGKTDVQTPGTSVTVALLATPSMDGVTKVRLVATVSRNGQTKSSKEDLSTMPEMTVDNTREGEVTITAKKGTFLDGDRIVVSLKTLKGGESTWESSQVASTTISRKTSSVTLTANLTVGTTSAMSAKIAATLTRGEKTASCEKDISYGLPTTDFYIWKSEHGNKYRVHSIPEEGKFVKTDSIEVYLLITEDGSKRSQYWGSIGITGTSRTSFTVTKSALPTGANIEAIEVQCTLMRNGVEVETETETLVGTPVVAPVTPPGAISTPPATTPPPVSTPAPGEIVKITKQVAGRTITVSATSGQFYKSSDTYMIYVMAANGTTQTTSPKSIEDGTSFEATVSSEMNISEGSLVMIGILRYNNGVALSYGIPIQ